MTSFSFHITGSSALATFLIGALFAAICGALLVILWPQRIPGPVTARERATARARGWQRWSASWVAALTGLAALGALALLVIELSPERTLVLVSRHRSAVPAATATCRGGAEPRGTWGDVPEDAVDLRPLVDAALRRCGREPHRCDVTTPLGHGRARQIVREVVSEWLQGHLGAQVGTEPLRRLSSPVVDGIEIGIVGVALRRSRAERAFVAAPLAFDSARSWEVASVLGHEAGLPLDVCGSQSTSRDDAPTVARITDARVRRDGTISFWALVLGRFEGQRPVDLEFEVVERLEASRDLVSWSVQAPADELESRLVYVCAGACDAEAHALAPLRALDASDARALVMSAASGRRLEVNAVGTGAAARVGAPLTFDTGAPPRLVAFDPVASRPLARLLARVEAADDARDPTASRARQEAERMSGFALPTIVEAPGQEAADAWIVAMPRAVALARSREDARALTAGLAPVASRGTDVWARVDHDLLGANTLFSFRGIPVRTLARPGPTPGFVEVMVGSILPMDGFARSPWSERIGANTAIAEMGRFEGMNERAIVLWVDRASILDESEPAAGLALVRFLSLALAALRTEVEIGGPGLEQDPDSGMGILAMPVAWKEDAEDLEGEAWWQTDAFGVILLMAVALTFVARAWRAGRVGGSR